MRIDTHVYVYVMFLLFILSLRNDIFQHLRRQYVLYIIDKIFEIIFRFHVKQRIPYSSEVFLKYSTVLLSFKVVRQLVRQLVYTIFIAKTTLRFTCGKKKKKKKKIPKIIRILLQPL